MDNDNYNFEFEKGRVILELKYLQMRFLYDWALTRSRVEQIQKGIRYFCNVIFREIRGIQEKYRLYLKIKNDDEYFTYEERSNGTYCSFCRGRVLNKRSHHRWKRHQMEIYYTYFASREHILTGKFEDPVRKLFTDIQYEEYIKRMNKTYDKF